MAARAVVGAIARALTLSAVAGRAARAASCRHASPDPKFDKAPWGELSKLVNVQDLQVPDVSALGSGSGSALQVTSMAGATFASGSMGSPSVPGWAMTNTTPAKVVSLSSALDAQQAMKFASTNNLRIAVKSTGHDWFGRSMGSGSLLLWTHKMTGTAWLDSFTPDGCAASAGAAVTLGAGVQFWQYYTEAMQHNRMVMGGTCSTVGHVGFTLGGGYGDYSRMYGSGATNLVQAEVVLGDGTVVTASACNDYADLFRALRGGGGAFGLVTKATYRTYPYPAGKIGTAFGSVKDLRAGTGKFLSWYAGILRQGKAQHFGGQVAVGGWAGSAVKFQMKYVGISAQECTKLCAPLGITCRDGGRVWPPAAAQMNPGGQRGWQESWENVGVTAYHQGTLQRYVNQDQLGSAALADTVAAAAQSTTVWLALNYVLGQGSPAALAHAKETSVHPQVYQAVLSVKIEMSDHGGLPNSRTQINQAALAKFAGMRDGLDAALPGAGSYYNEGDYTDEAWQERYWGSNYQDLLRTKAKYDPGNAFTCHQCVGSEASAPSGASCGRRLEAERGRETVLV